MPIAKTIHNISNGYLVASMQSAHDVALLDGFVSRGSLREAQIHVCKSPSANKTGGTEKRSPDTCAEKFESLERINLIHERNGNFDLYNSCKRLVPSRLHELHESKFPFVSRIEFIHS